MTATRRFGDQDYSALKQRALRQRQLFYDPTFTPYPSKTQRTARDGHRLSVPLATLEIERSAHAAPAAEPAHGARWSMPAAAAPAAVPPPAAAPNIDAVVWRPCREIALAPRLVSDGLPRQRDGATAWIVAAAAVLTVFPDLLDAVVPDRAAQDWPDDGGCRRLPTGQTATPFHPGIFRFRFWRLGRRCEVVVDSALPCRAADGALLYARGVRRAGAVLWPLLEKAYAKLVGGYAVLQQSTSTRFADVLADLSGRWPETVAVHWGPDAAAPPRYGRHRRHEPRDSDEASTLSHDAQQQGLSRLLAEQRKAAWIAAVLRMPLWSTAPSGTPKTAGTPSLQRQVFPIRWARILPATAPDHAATAIVCLRDPWGKHSWLPREAKTPWAAAAYAAAPVAVQHLMGDDVIGPNVIMLWTHFVSIFATWIVAPPAVSSAPPAWWSRCLPPLRCAAPTTTTCEGYWPGNALLASASSPPPPVASPTASPAPLPVAIDPQTPQYLLRIAQPDDVLLHLTQIGSPLRDGLERGMVPMGLVVVRVERNRRHRLTAAQLAAFDVQPGGIACAGRRAGRRSGPAASSWQTRVGHVAPCAARDIDARFVLAPGTYVVLPTVASPCHVGGFRLGVASMRAAETRRAVLRPLTRGLPAPCWYRAFPMGVLRLAVLQGTTAAAASTPMAAMAMAAAGYHPPSRSSVATSGDDAAVTVHVALVDAGLPPVARRWASTGPIPVTPTAHAPSRSSSAGSTPSVPDAGITTATMTATESPEAYAHATARADANASISAANAFVWLVRDPRKAVLRLRVVRAAAGHGPARVVGEAHVACETYMTMARRERDWEIVVPVASARDAEAVPLLTALTLRIRYDGSLAALTE
ncbi:hypothetical protein CXG81DRAFT_24090 [Caulochytrium protostelioides]|uniref:Calpain catalytic domain-containing protein n=1 Tax=Caulochytrium protostelioides TaxID=1555241 RepID=A0A4P9XCY7_9FUNG|nr:hypothetical protein CXG81DRAFT_24090 [Caulochytrium protostelioides]|eukprot:RKP03315.1 hypothetical protein CXG81DRAFT_24090 [Caulochytrium protostelioides]